MQITLVHLLIALLIGAFVGWLIGHSLSRAGLATVRAERDSALSQVRESEAAKEIMTNQFKVLSSEVLTRQTAIADAEAAERLDRTKQLLSPLDESLRELNRRLVEVERERSNFTSQLAQQVTAVTLAEENLRRETSSLATALRKPQVRGAWGELTLRRVVEISGMLNHVHFFEQSTTVNSGESVMRPDLQVLLGDGAFVYVDSKVPLSSFLDAYDADDAERRDAFLTSFGRTVRNHVDALAAKKYHTAGIGTPEFVVLFIPSESLSAQALHQQPDLMEYAAGKGIVLASPSTLIGMLRAISYGWKQANLAENAAEVFELGRELYARLSTLGGYVDKLGRSLHGSVEAYNQAVGSLESRVFVTARKFNQLELIDDELKPLSAVEQAPRSLSAPELLEGEDGD